MIKKEEEAEFELPSELIEAPAVEAGGAELNEAPAVEAGGADGADGIADLAALELQCEADRKETEILLDELGAYHGMLKAQAEQVCLSPEANICSKRS